MSMKRILTPFLLSAALIALFIGCGRGRAGQRVEIPDLGFTMELPGGWWTTSFNPYHFFVAEDPENCFGEVASLRSGGLPLISFVNRQVETEKEFQGTGGQMISGAPEATTPARTETVSRTYRDVNGVNSVELVLRRDGFHIFTVWLARGEEVVKVSFQVPDDDYPRWREKLVAAGKSIVLR